MASNNVSIQFKDVMMCVGGATSHAHVEMMSRGARVSQEGTRSVAGAYQLRDLFSLLFIADTFNDDSKQWRCTKGK